MNSGSETCTGIVFIDTWVVHIAFFIFFINVRQQQFLLFEQWTAACIAMEQLLKLIVK